MKKMFLLISALTVIALSSCQQDQLTDNQSEIQGKPGMLSFSINRSDIKTRAMQQTPYDDTFKESEKTVNNFTVFVYNEDGTLNVPAKYFSSFEDANSDGTSDLLNIPITSSATEVLVVANLGSPYDNTSALFKAIDSTPTKSLLDASVDLDPAHGNTGYTTAGNLLQTGRQVIAWVGSSATADVRMKFVPARISLEEVKIFPDGNMDQAGIKSISLKEVYILNASSLSFITENTSGLNHSLTSHPVLYTGKNVQAIAESKGYGVYYPTPLYDRDIAPLVNSDLYASVSEIPNSSTGEYPYFYVWENPTTVRDQGVTLLVIECEVVMTGENIAQRRYYTIPFNTAGLSKVMHNYHYHIKATIKSAGTDNPYDIMQNLGLTVTKPTWEEQNLVTVDFE